MSYVALYREWRPRVFRDIIGQEHITRTLENQITQGRIAHAYLFCGTRGTGKTTTAKVFAKAVNCLNPDGAEPCGECEICTGIDGGNMMDVIEIDAASNNGVDNIRDLRDDVKYPPSKCRYKVYIIDEVHMLSAAAFNALLKTLEEPPEHVIFILATTEFQKVPATIVSRCQRFDFKRITSRDIKKRMSEIAQKEGIKAEPKALDLIARSSDGAMRDALSIFDECISMSGGDVTYDDVVSVLGITTDEYLIRIADAVAESDAAKCISLIDELVINGKDVYQFIRDLTFHFRNLLICGINENASEMLSVSDETFGRLKEQAKKFSTESLLRNINILSDAESNAKWMSQPRIILETAAIKMCRPEIGIDADSILERISRLERAVFSGNTGRPVCSEAGAGETGRRDAVPGNGGEAAAETTQPAKGKEKDVPAKTTEDSAPGVTFEEIESKWKDIMKAINAGGNKTLYAFLLAGKPVSLSDSTLTIGFKQGYEFHRGRVDEENNRKLTEEYINKVCGSRIRIKCSMMDEVAADKQQKSLVDKAIDTFGSDMVDVEE